MSPFPWKFHKSLYGDTQVIVDAHGRMLAESVSIEDAPLLAAGPFLLEIAQMVAKRQDELGERARIALRALALPSG
jgi:hypothetical protein